MAYTVVMEKEQVNKVADVLYDITVKVTVNDGTEDIFVELITKRYNTNVGNLDNVKADILAELQEKWDKYVAEQNIKNAAAFDTALAEMQATATTYVNS